jgi:hypothetical protein
LAVFIRCPRCFARFLVWTAKEDPTSGEPLGDYVFLAEILSVEGVM